MQHAETILRLIIIGQELLIAAVFLFGSGGRQVRFGGVALVLSIVGYLVVSGDPLWTSASAAAPLFALLAIAVPYALWFFARALFEAPWPNRTLVWVIAGTGVLTWCVFLLQDRFSSEALVTLFNVNRVIALGVVAHALWMTLRGRPDDLIERRRTFRLFFVGVISLQVAAVLIVELILAGADTPAWLEMTNVVIIAILTLGLSVPLLKLDSEFFGPGAATPPSRAPLEAIEGADGIYARKLKDLMDAGGYRETGLTIPALARKLDYPEHRLRQLINGQLGYRNFSAFLNSYRLEAAKRDLSDPEKARTPVLTIALDLGYASLGPFNRAFKAGTGITPTEFRRQNINRIAESE